MAKIIQDLINGSYPFTVIDGYPASELDGMPDQVVIRIEVTVGELNRLRRAYLAIHGDGMSMGYKIWFRQVWCGTLYQWMKQTIYCHLILRFRKVPDSLTNSQ